MLRATLGSVRSEVWQVVGFDRDQGISLRSTFENMTLCNHQVLFCPYINLARRAKTFPIIIARLDVSLLIKERISKVERERLAFLFIVLSCRS